MKILALLFGEHGSVRKLMARRWRGAVYVYDRTTMENGGAYSWTLITGAMADEFMPRNATLPPLPMPAQQKPHRCSITITLRQAEQLVEFFGESDTEVTVFYAEAGSVKPEDPEDGECPAGLYAHVTEYPEEGCTYLGATEVDETRDGFTSKKP